MIVATVLAYVPTSIFVFMPIDHKLTDSQLATYQSAYAQVHDSFIVGVNESSNCTYNEALLNNNYCLVRYVLAKVGPTPKERS